MYCRKKRTLFLSLLLVISLLCTVLFTSCKENPSSEDENQEENTEQKQDWLSGLSYDEASYAVYDKVLSEFLRAYEEIGKEDNLFVRYALMAIAEAKLLESGVLLPIGTGNRAYAISRIVPYTASSLPSKLNSVGYRNACITSSPIAREHREYLVELWRELFAQGTTDTYGTLAKEYLIENGYTLVSSCALSCNALPDSWDNATSESEDARNILANVSEGLLCYDVNNRLSCALATSYEYNWEGEGWTASDGYKVTFTLRQGVRWVNADGQVIGEVKADDFVLGFQHSLDACAGQGSVLSAIVLNADQYIEGVTVDFDDVGIRAKDKYTLEFTLSEKAASFDSMVACASLYPINRAFYEYKNGKLGSAYDPTDESCFYGKTYRDIAYCGAYTVSSSVAGEGIVLEKNPSYWNADGVSLDSITYFFHGSDSDTRAYDDVKSNTVAYCVLNDATLEAAKNDTVEATGLSYFDQYAYALDTGLSVSLAAVNLNRTCYVGASGENSLVSEKTEEQRALSRAALLNQSFRLALSMATDRAALCEITGEAPRNMLSSSELPLLGEEVTVKIGGVDTVFAAGTSYGAIVQAQLDADGIPITVWHSDEDGGAKTGVGFDGWCNAQNAKAFLDKAINELKGEGYTVDGDHPVVLDLPMLASDEICCQYANTYKSSVEQATGGLVIVNLVSAATPEKYGGAYLAGSGEDSSNYDVFLPLSMHTPYFDPMASLDAFLPYYVGSMTYILGIY